ncbi:hypothetical protein SEA_AMYEV_39 [Arthrobacter phage Amyev]|uniref:Uncharacterized protein n=1 Tax=Arthrobacter phage Amyev TaxID=2832315 RepID=A0AA48Y4C4_9CAUD|nr:hypothetical protein PQD88_gp39 [Arthrobacter phage Amyev]UIW13483.1 hypothetical protein SEA_AMYEV_39 [Arthrobacter phage Amyev]
MTRLRAGRRPRAAMQDLAHPTTLLIGRVSGVPMNFA